jgi:hypothetical protein
LSEARASYRRGVAIALGAVIASCTGRDLSLGEGRARQAPPEPGQLTGFTEPQPIAGLGDEDAKDDDPALTADLLTLYFNSKREGGQGQEDIWFSQRTGRDEPFSAPLPERALNSSDRETGLALASDGLSLWFSSDRDGGDGGLDVYLATRASPSSAWSVTRVSELNSDGDDLVSSLADGERTLFLARRDDDDDDYDLYLARRSDRARPFSAPEPIEALNSDDEESDAVWLEGGGGLVFTRDEQLVHAPAYPAVDGSVLPLSELNSKDDDRDAWFSGDLSYVVFSSDRSGSYRLYEARRAP